MWILDYQNIYWLNHLMNLWPSQPRYEETKFWWPFWKTTAKGVKPIRKKWQLFLFDFQELWALQKCIMSKIDMNFQQNYFCAGYIRHHCNLKQARTSNRMDLIGYKMSYPSLFSWKLADMLPERLWICDRELHRCGIISFMRISFYSWA